LREPWAQLACVERYIKDSKSKGTPASPELLRGFYEEFRAQAERSTEKSMVPAVIMWLLTWRLGQFIGEMQSPPQLVKLLTGARDLVGTFRKIEDETLVEMVCEALVAARTDWPEQLLTLPALARGFVTSGRSPQRAGLFPSYNRWFRKS
jgi:hypothetical protein